MYHLSLIIMQIPPTWLYLPVGTYKLSIQLIYCWHNGFPCFYIIPNIYLHNSIFTKLYLLECKYVFTSRCKWSCIVYLGRYIIRTWIFVHLPFYDQSIWDFFLRLMINDETLIIKYSPRESLYSQQRELQAVYQLLQCDWCHPWEH